MRDAEKAAERAREAEAASQDARALVGDDDVLGYDDME